MCEQVSLHRKHISTTDTGGTVYHAYDGIHCVADLDGGGSLLRSYTWGAGIDNLLAVTLYDNDSTNTLYAVTDPLGTIHALVASDGTIAVSYTYDSWGNLLSATGDESLITALRFMWQGREYSHATGLYNFRARWYDPAAGRWLSKDPIGLEGGLNLYEAFGNNPVNYIDPCGDDIADYDLDWVYDVSDFAAGFGDVLSFKLTKLFRKGVGIIYEGYDDIVDVCSDEYKNGEYAGIIYGLITGGGRLLYAGTAKVCSVVILRKGATAANAAKAVKIRNLLKNLFNLGVNTNKPLTMEVAISKYNGDYTAIIKAAGRTATESKVFGIDIRGGWNYVGGYFFGTSVYGISK